MTGTDVSSAGRTPDSPMGASQGAQPLRPPERLQKALGYTFKNARLLENALVHKSYLYAVPDSPLTSNERLEFLGDAVLGLLASTQLFTTYPDVAEGELSALRGVLVRLSTLAELAAPIELGEYLYLSKGDEAAGGRARAGTLGRAMEAILGAVYLDGGLRAAEEVWTRLLGERSLEQLQEVLSADYKSKLQQEAQALLRETPRYRLIETSGPDHARLFKVEVLVGDESLGEGVGSNKQIAQQEAARAALPHFEALKRGLTDGEDIADGDGHSEVTI